MAETVSVDNDISSMKAGANQIVSDSQENVTNGCNGTTNGVSNKNQEIPITNKATDMPTSSAIEPVADPSSGETKAMETVNLAMQHIAAGKRDLLISDPHAAVASLALACELLGSHCGEMAFVCGEAFYYYGRALLDLARLEAGVIENLDGDGGQFAIILEVKTIFSVSFNNTPCVRVQYLF